MPLKCLNATIHPCSVAPVHFKVVDDLEAAPTDFGQKVQSQTKGPKSGLGRLQLTRDPKEDRHDIKWMDGLHSAI